MHALMKIVLAILSACVFILPNRAFANPIGWSDGQVAVGMADAVRMLDPMLMVIPQEVGVHVTQRTAVLYFSPTCPHCQAVIPEINHLAETMPEVQWIAVASAHSDPQMIEAFIQAYGVIFPIIHDVEGRFSTAMGAKATPNVYIFDPIDSTEGSEPLGDSISQVTLVDAYLPYARGFEGLLKMRHSQSGNPFEHFQGYQGSRVCMSCHIQEGRSWLMTHHAQAYYTLYKIDKTDDAKCVGCHVVGLNEPTGFVLGDHNSPLVGVGCESCHSSSGGHDGESVDAKESCVQCHDAEHSIQFSLEKGLPHIDHYASNHLSDEEIQQRMAAISDGTADKPLLNFPKGSTVGSERCLTCHEGMHPKDPHRNAVNTLPRKKRSKDECLVCHATPLEIFEGPVLSPRTVTDYHSKEGVGCESCHGAGIEHVANPTKENIVGLGASCPVCVLESMCTSCHTPKWDPTWDLDTRLKIYQSE